MPRQNPRHRKSVEPLHDIADLARMLGTEPQEAAGVLRVMWASGYAELYTDDNATDERFKRFTVARFDAEAMKRDLGDAARFRELFLTLKDILGIPAGDDE